MSKDIKTDQQKDEYPYQWLVSYYVGTGNSFSFGCRQLGSKTRDFWLNSDDVRETIKLIEKDNKDGMKAVILNYMKIGNHQPIKESLIAQEWRLAKIKPKHDNDVLVYFDKGFIGVANWDKKEKEWQQDGYNILGSRTGNSDVTHWRELPAPPLTKDKEE